MTPHVLLVEDEVEFRTLAAAYLREHGFSVTQAGDAACAVSSCRTRPPDVVLLDIGLPDRSGLEVLRELRAQRADLRVVVLTSYDDAAHAVAALKGGATDYLTKPIEFPHLLEGIRQALHEPTTPLPPEPKPLRPKLDDALWGESTAWLEVLARVERVAHSGIDTLLLLGESGTGKSAIARRFHELSPRAHGPFVELDCPSLPEQLLESELFGHEKGAFTGAVTRKRGQVELAEGGTLFLDEVGELPLNLQPKLLRFLERRRFRRVGGETDQAANLQLVCATNRDLRQEAERGHFRSDLFYRLEVVSILMPPLRARDDDAATIAQGFVQRFAAARGRPAPQLTPAARAALRAHSFPGNIRELKNLIQRAMAFLEGDSLDAPDLEIGGRLAPAPSTTNPTSGASDLPHPVDLELVLRGVEAHCLDLALRSSSSQREAGARLGLDRFALARRRNRVHRLGHDTLQHARQNLPAWLHTILGDLPRELPQHGIDLTQWLQGIEDQAIAFALRHTDDNRSRAAALLGMSRPTLVRRLEDRPDTTTPDPDASDTP